MKDFINIVNPKKQAALAKALHEIYPDRTDAMMALSMHLRVSFNSSEKAKKSFDLCCEVHDEMKDAIKSMNKMEA